MPAPELSDRKHTVLLWTYQYDDRHGQPVVAAPVQIMVRLTRKRRLGADAKGNIITLDATAQTAQYIEPRSLIWVGTMQDWTGTGTGTHSPDDMEIYEVMACNYEDDLKKRWTGYQVNLSRYRKDIPEGQ